MSKTTCKYTVEKLLTKATLISIDCTLSTVHEENCHHTILYLKLFSHENTWYLSGHPLSEIDSRFFTVDKPLQLLYALSAGAFPLSVPITAKNTGNKLFLFFSNVNSYTVESWRE